jgi:four helix bundle protein
LKRGFEGRKAESGGRRNHNESAARFACKDKRIRSKNHSLVSRITADILGKQLFKSGTSVAAHYREACRARSDLDFISKLEGGQQELDESDLWLELLADSGVIKPNLVQPLRQETNELIAILVTMTKNVKKRRHHDI